MFNEEVLNLINKEFLFTEFQQQFEKMGFMVEEEKEIVKEIIEQERVTYFHKLNNEWDINIVFDITIRADEEEEDLSASYVKITDIF